MTKTKTHRSKAYLAFVHTMPSVVSGKEGEDIVAHHVRLCAGAGMGQKPSDYWCLPLTNAEHRELHDKGERTFWERKGVSPHGLICMNLLAYAAKLIYEGEDFVNAARLLDGVVASLEGANDG